MGKVLIKDIAEALGMSRNTVAKALKNDNAVLESTRKKVIIKAQEMGYQKLDATMIANFKIDYDENEFANKKFAILMSDFGGDDFWQGIIWGIIERIKKANGSCFMVIVSSEEREKLIVPSALLSGEIEGIMCLTIFPSEYRKKFSELGIPIVFMDAPVQRLSDRMEHDLILLSGTRSVYLLTEDLINRGCQNIGFIGDITYSETIKDRFIGYKQALEDAGKNVNWNNCVVEADDLHYYSEEAVEEKLDKMKVLPDAFVCANDYIAVIVVQYCKKRGIAVPGRVAVTGFDDKKECMIMEPHITSVNIMNYGVGMRIADQLLWRIKNPMMSKEMIYISTEPCFRESSAR